MYVFVCVYIYILICMYIYNLDGWMDGNGVYLNQLRCVCVCASFDYGRYVIHCICILSMYEQLYHIACLLASAFASMYTLCI